jgi:enterochelin esterase-like enzyme
VCLALFVMVMIALPSAPPARASGLAGALFDTELYSPILGRTLPFRIYVPPDYFTTDTRRYPVIYMLHGAGGNYTEWSDSYLPDDLDVMIQRGDVQPMIAVLPEGGGRTYWANWNAGPQWADYLTYDVVNEVDSRFRTIPAPGSRAIGGLSMGGWGALHIAMRHPDVFGVVGAHSPSVRNTPDEELWFLSGQNWYEHSPSWLARNAPGAERNVYWIDVGDQDWWRQNIEDMRDAMWSAGLNINWHVFSGTHEAEYWIEHVPDYLRFYSDNLRG